MHNLAGLRAQCVRSGCSAADGVFSFSNKPLKAAWLTGLFWAVLGAVIAFVLLVCLLFGVQGVAWWLASLMMVLSGNLLICLGIAGEYIGRIYMEVKGRPRYIIAKRTDDSTDDLRRR